MQEIYHISWHHWIDDNPEVGIWLCCPCHKAVEHLGEMCNIEIPKYLELKRKAENGEL